MKAIISLLFVTLYAVSASALCEADAVAAAKQQAAEDWGLKSTDTLATEVIENLFSETYGKGEYVILVTTQDGSDEKELTVYMTAYSNWNDTEFTCEVDEVVEY